MQLGELQEAYPQFQRQNAEVVAISMDSIPSAAQMVALTGAQFPVLSDAEGKVVHRYGVYNLLGDGVAAPATFIVSRGGVIQWRHVGQNIADRPSADEILLRLQDLKR
jgi:peroxiredoxin